MVKVFYQTHEKSVLFNVTGPKIVKRCKFQRTGRSESEGREGGRENFSEDNFKKKSHAARKKTN